MLKKAAKELLFRLKTEPVLRNALITLLFSVITAFGIPTSDEIKAAVIAVLVAIFGGITRQEVAPMIKVKDNGLKEDDTVRSEIA